jgi:hypothetical protein
MNCKDCDEKEPLNEEGFCFWCWEAIQEGLLMLQEG